MSNNTDIDNKENQENLIKRLASKNVNGDGLTIDVNKFLTPDMGDFLGDEMTLEYLKEIENSMKDYSSNGYGAMFYIENPVVEELGYHPDKGVFVVSATPILTSTEESLNKFDGDTMHFNFDSLQDGGGNFEFAGKTYSNVKEYLQGTVSLGDFNKSRFTVRTLGIDCPEVPHYSTIKKTDALKVTTVTYEKIKSYDKNKYIIDKTIERKDKDLIDLVNLGGYEDKWHEYDPAIYETEIIKSTDAFGKEVETIVESLKMVTSDNSPVGDTAYHQQAIDAQQTYKRLLNECSEMRLVLDAKTINAKSGSLPKNYDDDFYESPLTAFKYPWSAIKRTWDSFINQGFSRLGYNSFGQDAYKRFLGAIYVKIYLPELRRSEWVNVAKYILANHSRVTPLPDYSSDPQVNEQYNFSSSAFKLWSYDAKNSVIIDAMQDLASSDLDNRKQIQQKIMQTNFEELTDFTVMIGDSLFMVPPTSIRSVSQTTSERMPLLRARGSATKSAQRVEKLIEMTLFFNNEEGINGIPCDFKLNNGETITYHMNGLRSLLSMFKFTPFLPIENNYINRILNIEAVSLVNIKVSTTPGYPRCLSATLTLQEFDYRIYMPELPVPDPNTDDINKNMFASTISFNTMRWYYQRAIANGENIKHLEVNDPKYIEATLGNKTALQPMTFQKSDVGFYIVDEDQLRTMLEVKKEAMSRPTKVIPTITEASKVVAMQIGQLYTSIENAINGSKVKNLLDSLNRPVADGDSIFPLVLDKNTFVMKLPSSTKEITNAHVFKGVKTSQYVYEVDTVMDIAKKYANPLIKEIDKALSSAPAYLGMKTNTTVNTISNKTGKKTEVEWVMHLNIDKGLIATDQEFQDFIIASAKELNSDDTMVANEVIEKGLIKISFKAVFNDKGEMIDNFGFHNNSGGYRLLQHCHRYYNIEDEDSLNDDSLSWDSTPSAGMQDEIVEIKNNLDWESADGFSFIKYETGDIKIKNISTVFGNTLTRMNVQSSDGYAPQYAGGQDTMIELAIETKDEYAVLMLNQLPTLAARYARDYRLVLSTWPIRIDSEITRLLGVNEVTIESVDVTTVPGHPGLYNINMRLISVDRTLRNREALKKLEMRSNAGSNKSHGVPSATTKSFFDAKDVLSKAELYPDLELPTIDELEEKGFKFIRYSNKTNGRVYPDPDFYFVYSHVLGSTIFRKTILEFIKENMPDNILPEFSLTDMYGCKVNIKPAEQIGFMVTGKNQSAEYFNEKKEQVDEASKYMERKDSQRKVKPIHSVNGNNPTEILDALTNAKIFQKWEVADTIQCRFREKEYESVFNEASEGFAKDLIDSSDKIISAIDEELNKPINDALEIRGSYKMKTHHNDPAYFQTMINKKSQFIEIETGINEFISDFFNKGIGSKIIELYQIPSSSKSKVVKSLKNMVMAAAAAGSGKVEAEKKSSYAWKPMMWVDSSDGFMDITTDTDSNGHLIPFCYTHESRQGLKSSRAKSWEDALNYGVEFGPFAIKQYTSREIENITGKVPSKATPNGGYFLDPFYHSSATDKQIEQYKIDIMSNSYAAARAYTRNMLVWMKKMLQDEILLSLGDLVQNKAIEAIERNESFERSMTDPRTAKYVIQYQNKLAEDAMTDEEKKERDEREKEARKNPGQAYMSDPRVTKYKPKEEETSEEKAKDVLADYKKVMEKSKTPLSVGKFFVPLLMALLDGEDTIYSRMKTRDYDGLNNWTMQQIMPSEDRSQELNVTTYKFRKFIKALVALKVIKDEGKIGSHTTTVGELNETALNEGVYIAAAENPVAYLSHSFYDMITNDKRGRMARAFPTFYMMFIDEGREIGMWKLHDNFYNMSAIGEIQVTKSRKIAADTAKISMSNMFKSYTTDDEDGKGGDDYNWKDAFTSIFSPRFYYQKEEMKRLQEQPMERARLKPGVRIHIRMGYGSNAASLPIVFNGTVAEVSTGEVVEIIAQGDGVELTNPILSNMDAEDIQHNDDFILSKKWKEWITKGATPRTILGSLLTDNGGWNKKMINKWSNGRFFNDNPYGIVHFGEKEFTDIFASGEVVQNIYEASAKPSWGNNELVASHIADQYAMDDAPKISTHIFGKSYWDIMNICASASPDFVSSVIPFQFRSSIFYGAPRYYAAYDYEKSQKDTVLEKRKPFQQYHIYTSYSDIIGNMIKASDQDVRTCAVGIYSSSGWLGSEKAKRVGPMWVDFDIYPEKQKTMTFDTQLLAKGSAVGDIIPFVNWLQNELSDDQGKIQGGYALAWRMTAAALKNAVKDMYQGEIVVIGDPSVKPYDKIWIEDVYERMQGSFEAEAVVHNFTVTEGYTTSIYADCIACVDDRYEQIAQNLGNSVVAKSVGAYTAVVLTSALFAGSTKPLITAMLGYASKAGGMGQGVINNIGKVIGSEKLESGKGWISKADDAAKFFGISGTNIEIDKLLMNSKKWHDTLTTINIDNVGDAVTQYKKLIKVYDDLDPSSLVKLLKETEAAGGLKASEIDKVKSAISKLDGNKGLKNGLNSVYREALGGIDSSSLDLVSKQLLKIIDDPKLVGKIGGNVDELAIIAGKLGGKGKVLSSVDDLKDLTEALKIVGEFTDNADELAVLLSSSKDMFDAIKKNKSLIGMTDDIASSKGIMAIVSKLGFGAGAGFVATMVALALEMAIVHVVTSFVYEYIERWMKNLQVLQIFPLKKDGKAYTAGLDGSKGVVVGSPTEGDPGQIEGWLANLFEDKEGGWKATIYNVVKGTLATSNMEEIASKYRSRIGMPNPESVVNNEELIQGLLRQIASDEMKSQNYYRSAVLRPRISELTDKNNNLTAEAKELFRKYTVPSETNIEQNPKIAKDMVPLNQSVQIKEMMDKKHLMLSHEIEMNEGLSSSNYYTGYKTFLLEGKKVSIPTIFETNSNSKQTIDLPFLRPDSYALLLEILNKLDTVLDEPSSQHGEESLYKKHPVIIKSALRPGDQWRSTGLVFRMQVVGYSNISKILAEIEAEQKEVYGMLNSKDNQFFKSKMISSDTYDIMVLPPKELI